MKRLTWDAVFQPPADALVWAIFFRLDRSLRRIRNDAPTP